MISARIHWTMALISLTLHACKAPAPITKADPASDSIRQEIRYKKSIRRNDPGVISTVTLDQVFQKQAAESALILDARTAYFYQLGHIPGALSVPADNCDLAIHQLEPKIQEMLAAGKTLIVYCAGPGCTDARTLARHIAAFGYPVAKFSGGWHEWKGAQLPIATTPNP